MSGSSEEKLAQEVVSRIREWAGKAGAGRNRSRVALKFCGGCNPQIERGLLAKRIREGLPVSDFQWVSGEEDPDLLILINGCATACADTAETCGKAPFVLTTAGDFLIVFRAGKAAAGPGDKRAG